MDEFESLWGRKSKWCVQIVQEILLVVICCVAQQKGENNLQQQKGCKVIRHIHSIPLIITYTINVPYQQHNWRVFRCSQWQSSSSWQYRSYHSYPMRIVSRAVLGFVRQFDCKFAICLASQLGSHFVPSKKKHNNNSNKQKDSIINWFTVISHT